MRLMSLGMVAVVVVLMASLVSCGRPHTSGVVRLSDGDTLDNRLRTSFRSLGGNIYRVEVAVPTERLDVALTLNPLEIQLLDSRGKKLHPTDNEDPWVMVAEHLEGYPPANGKEINYSRRAAQSFRLDRRLIPRPGAYRLVAVLRVVESGKDAVHGRLYRDGGSVACPQPKPLRILVAR